MLHRVVISLYARLLEDVLLPLHNAVRRRSYVRHRRFLEESQWWSRERILEFQWQELEALLDHVFHQVPYYREKYAAAGVRREEIRTLEDFARLPVLTRREIEERRAGLCAPSYRGRLLPHATGGSSGVPTRFFITRESYDWRTAAAQRVYSWSGCRLGERTVYLWGAPIGTPPLWKSLKQRAFFAAQRQLFFNTFTQTPELWQRIFEQAVRFRPVLLVGYVSSLEAFAAHLSGRGLRLPSLRAAMAAAEPLSESTRQRLEALLGVPLFNTYGSREFMSIAAECDHRQGLHTNAENLLVETAGPATGGPAELLVTDLHNYGMPFVRYAIGDVGLLDGSACACGRGLPRIRSVEGRGLDVLRAADGRVVPGEFFPHLLKEFPEIREYQVRQKSLDRIVILAVLSRPLPERSRSLLEQEVCKVFGGTTRVELEPVESIPRLASGKRRVTVGLGQDGSAATEEE